MKKKLGISCILIIVCCALYLGGCGSDTSTSDSDISSHLSEYDSYFAQILTLGSSEFMGHHPLDESFLDWFVANYSYDALTTILNSNAYDDAAIWYELTGKSIHVLWYEYSVYAGLNEYENSYTYVIEPKLDGNFVLDITGDVSLAEDMATSIYMSEQDNGLMDCLDDSVISAINESDVFIVNNEFAYTSGGDPIVEKYYTFRANPAKLSELKRVGVDLVTIANNHIYDYSKDGFIDTLNTLEEGNMPYIGAGRNLSDAKRPVYYIALGKKIAIVNASEIEINQNFTKAATKDSEGILKCLDPSEFNDEIRWAKRRSDIVIAIVHWGIEYEDNYGSDQRQLAEEFASAGADVVVGGHPHVLQGFDYIGDVPVYYSLGNFYFSLDSDMPDDYDTGLAQIIINSDGDITAGFVPCNFSGGVLSKVTSSTGAQDIYDRLNGVSGAARLDKNGKLYKY